MDFLLKKIKNALFYERWTCNVCNSEIFSGYFCLDCEKQIERINENKCNHCGRATAYPVNYCDSCIEKNINFNFSRSVFNYKPPISNLIQRFKYGAQKYHGRYFAEELYKIFLKENFPCDLVTFVPMSEERFEETKYNHAEVIASEFSKLSGIELSLSIKKVKETPRQATLSLNERLKNLKSAFRVNKKAVKDKNVIVIDDVLTTGATCDTISKLLKKNGAQSVIVLTVASVSKYDKNI